MKRYIRIDLEVDIHSEPNSFFTMDIARAAVERATGGKVIFSRNSPTREDLNRDAEAHRI